MVIRVTEIDTIALYRATGIGGNGIAIPFNVKSGSQGNNAGVDRYNAVAKRESDMGGLVRVRIVALVAGTIRGSPMVITLVYLGTEPPREGVPDSAGGLGMGLRRASLV